MPHDASGHSPEHATYPFDAMKLKVGDRLQIQPPPQLAQDRYIVRLVGYLPNVSLLVTAPTTEGGLPLQLLEGEQLVIRVFSSQNAFGFSTVVDRICKTPFDYLHLSFPTEVQGMVIRTAPRVKTRIITSVTQGKLGEETVPAVISNLSANGALLDAAKVLADKEQTVKLAFKISLHGYDSILEISAEVKALSQVEDTLPGSPTHHRHGIHFVGLHPNENMLLQSLIYQQMVEHPETVT
jgi:hypothetical protein